MQAVNKVQTTDRNINQLQSNIIPPLNALLQIPIVNGVMLTEISLSAGANVVNTTLNRPLIGWIPVRFRGGSAVLYDTQADNTTPGLTLQLNASAPVTIDLWVF